MIPSIGRIVHYKHENDGYVMPAIITKVWTPKCVNLQIFIESPMLLLKTSVLQGNEKGQW